MCGCSFMFSTVNRPTCKIIFPFLKFCELLGFFVRLCEEVMVTRTHRSAASEGIAMQKVL